MNILLQSQSFLAGLMMGYTRAIRNDGLCVLRTFGTPHSNWNMDKWRDRDLLHLHQFVSTRKEINTNRLKPINKRQNHG